MGSSPTKSNEAKRLPQLPGAQANLQNPPYQGTEPSTSFEVSFHAREATWNSRHANKSVSMFSLSVQVGFYHEHAGLNCLLYNLRLKPCELTLVNSPLPLSNLSARQRVQSIPLNLLLTSFAWGFFFFFNNIIDMRQRFITMVLVLRSKHMITFLETFALFDSDQTLPI